MSGVNFREYSLSNKLFSIVGFLFAFALALSFALSNVSVAKIDQPEITSTATPQQLKGQALTVFRDITCDHLVADKDVFGTQTDLNYSRLMENCREQIFTLTEVSRSENGSQLFQNMYTRLLITVTNSPWKFARPENYCEVDLRIDLRDVLRVNSAGNIQFSLEKINWRSEDSHCAGSLLRSKFLSRKK